MQPYKVIKRINGHSYIYQQKTQREGQTVRTIYCKCLGRASFWDVYNYSKKLRTTDFPVFQGFQDVTLDILENLRGRALVSKQYIIDLTKQSSVKPHIKAMLVSILDNFSKEQIPVTLFANEAKTFLLQLTNQLLKTPLYRKTTLPREFRGEIERYQERIYESSILNDAGQIHFSGQKINNYFAHTRFEDIPNNTRRMLEVQSDFFQRTKFKNLFSKQIPVIISNLLRLLVFTPEKNQYFLFSVILTLLDNYLTCYPYRND